MKDIETKEEKMTQQKKLRTKNDEKRGKKIEKSEKKKQNLKQKSFYSWEKEFTKRFVRI